MSESTQTATLNGETVTWCQKHLRTLFPDARGQTERCPDCRVDEAEHRAEVAEARKDMIGEVADAFAEATRGYEDEVLQRLRMKLVIVSQGRWQEGSEKNQRHAAELREARDEAAKWKRKYHDRAELLDNISDILNEEAE